MVRQDELRTYPTGRTKQIDAENHVQFNDHESVRLALSRQQSWNCDEVIQFLRITAYFSQPSTRPSEDTTLQIQSALTSQKTDTQGESLQRLQPGNIHKRRATD